MKQWCVTVDAGEIPDKLITYLSESRRDKQEKCAGDSKTDHSPPTDEHQQNFIELQQMGRCHKCAVVTARVRFSLS